MPRYRNDTTTRITGAGQTIDPGMEVSTEVWLSPSLGLTQLSDEPMYNPIILSASYNSAGTVAIPAGERRFAVHFYVETGEVTIHFNSASNTPPLILYAGARWNLRYFERIVNDIRLSGTGFKVYIEIEKI